MCHLREKEDFLDRVPKASGLIAAVYFDLLLHPHDAWRAKNQKTLVAARDAVALLIGETPQEVQDRYEAKIAEISMVRP